MKAIFYLIARYWYFKTKHMMCNNTSVPIFTGILIGPNLKVQYLCGYIYGAQHYWYPDGNISLSVPEMTIRQFVKF